MTAHSENSHNLSCMTITCSLDKKYYGKALIQKEPFRHVVFYPMFFDLFVRIFTIQITTKDDRVTLQVGRINACMLHVVAVEFTNEQRRDIRETILQRGRNAFTCKREVRRPFGLRWRARINDIVNGRLTSATPDVDMLYTSTFPPWRASFFRHLVCDLLGGTSSVKH